MSDGTQILRFDTFELDPAAGELRKRGERIKLSPQPFKVLELLVRRGGEVVTRSEIRESIWRSDTFVDFEQSLNFCIRQIREAVNDTADTPRFIETLPRRGYRFLMPVEKPAHAPARVPRLIVLPFRMLRPDPGTDFLAFSLADALTTALSGLKSLVVRSTLVGSRFAAGQFDWKAIAAEADVDLIVTGTLLSAGDEIRLTAQLTEASSGTLLCSHSMQTSTGNVFRLQDELTECVVNALELRLTTREQNILRRDVPANPRAYEYYLRANQFSHDSKQWSAARELYERCVAEDPCYAPAWARLGRIYHVMSKYLASENKEGQRKAEAAFRQALELNPELAIAHKSYAQLEVDLGRASDAMARLIPRVLVAPDPEVFAGMVSPLCYCGLLDASAAAHRRAIVLEPKIRTSVPHTWFLQGDYQRTAATKLEDNPYIVALAMGEIGRTQEALPVLRPLEGKIKTRLGDFVVAARTLLEGDHAGSLSAIKRIVDSGFSDPQALFYLTRHLARLGQGEAAIDLFERAADGGFIAFPAMTRDPWLEPLRRNERYQRILGEVEAQFQKAERQFATLEGHRMLELDLRAA
jgi:DNA-binding winged helix-turn-helix (wHTH) protein/tetratricopeptide (TPR) repeat protein